MRKPESKKAGKPESQKDQRIREQQELIEYQRKEIEKLKQQLAERSYSEPLPYIPYPMNCIRIWQRTSSTTDGWELKPLSHAAMQWEGKDLKQCLDLVYATRSEAEFSL